MTADTTFPEQIITEYYASGTWNDISSYVVSDISGYGGLGSDDPNDRVAVLGTLKLYLDNQDRLFSPMGGDIVRGLPTLYGFNKGADLRIRIIYDTLSWVAWRGYIDDIKVDDGLWGDQYVYLNCVDWMEKPAKFPMESSTIEFDGTIDSAVASMTSRMAVPPVAEDFDEGDETFQYLFDEISGKTKAIREFDKLAKSEISYIYVLKDGTLRVEANSTRTGLRTPDTVWNVDRPFMLRDGVSDNVILQENGIPILLDMPEEEAAIDRTALNLKIERTVEPYNTGFVNAFPRRVDTELIESFRLGNPIRLAPGTTTFIKGRFVDPNGGQRIAATNLQSMVTGTGFQYWQTISGTGADWSSQISVTPTFYGDLADYQIDHIGSDFGFLTKLTQQGYGIYTDTPIQEQVVVSGSAHTYGENVLNYDMRYQQDLYRGLEFLNSYLNEYSQPKARVVEAMFDANYNTHHMMAFLQLDVGSLIAIYENRSGMRNYYYILSRAFKIALGGAILFTFLLMEAPSYASGQVEPLTLKFDQDSNDAIDYGYIPRISNMDYRTYSLWTRRTPEDLDADNIAAVMIGQLTDLAGIGIYTGTGDTQRLNVQVKCTSQGIWQSVTGTFPADSEWHHVLVTLDATTVTPLAYIDGANAPLTETVVHSGLPRDETNVPLVIGNEHTATFDYNVPFNGRIKDVRIYNRILTASEIAELYNGGTQSYDVGSHDGLKFWANFVFKDFGDQDSLEGQVFTPDEKLIDNVFKVAGTPHGSVTASENAWVLRTTPNQAGLGITYSPDLDLFAAVGNTAGTGTHVMTSPNGIDWTARTSPNLSLYSVAWSSSLSLFAATGDSGAILTSPNGIAWTQRTAPTAGSWRSVAWSPSLGLFVGVSIDAANQFMRSTDGTTWTGSTGSNVGGRGVTWVEEIGLFVCGTNGSLANQGIQTSPDGINWTLRTTNTSQDVYGIAYSPTLGLLVAVGNNGLCITSPDGINWTERVAAGLDGWKGVAWSPEFGIFMAITNGGAASAMQSSDGINWSYVDSPAFYSWYGLCWSDEESMFVAVQYNNSNTNRVMTYGRI
jgi:hypothetical protein